MAKYGDCNEEIVRDFSFVEVAEINCNSTILASLTNIDGVRFVEQPNTIILPFLVKYFILTFLFFFLFFLFFFIFFYFFLFFFIFLNSKLALEIHL